MSNTTSHLQINANSLGLAKEKIALRSVHGEEFLSKKFNYTLNCLSTEENLEDHANLGKIISFTISTQDASTKVKTKKVIGYVTEINPLGVFHKNGSLTENHMYDIHISSWLGIIDKTLDSRVFVEKDIKEIISTVLEKYSAFIPDSLVGYKYMKATHKPNLAVQYDESDAHFISRVLEETGLFYYFEYSDNGPVMQICDQASSYSTDDTLDMSKSTNIYLSQITGNKIYAKTTTQTNYSSQYSKPINQIQAPLYDYVTKSLDIYTHHETNTPEDSPELQAQSLRNKMLCDQNSFSGKTNHLGFLPGKYFTYIDSQYYALTSVSLHAHDASYFSHDGANSIHIDFTCIPRSVLFSSTHYERPSIEGLHRAFVMGDSSKHTHANEENMVQIGFHWDRYVKNDSSNAIWTPVIQSSAGAKQGFIMLPHVGDEVLVSFLDGDPYEPVIVGSTFTRKNKSTVNKKTDPDTHMLYTAGNNSLTFNDKKGNEQIQISSEKDLTLTCKDTNSTSQKTFNLTSTESSKLTQKTFELSADESVKIVAGKDGAGATLQMTQDGNLSIKIGPVVSLKISPSGEVTFTGTTEIKMMGNLEVIGNILATGNVHGTNI